ncbi:MAG: hypothetical protein AABX37_01530 [Nanoarchaeota archaeon]
MQNFTILNTRDVKQVKEVMEEDFGYALQGEYAFLKTEGDKLFLISKDLGNIDFSRLRIDKCGLYFAEFKEKKLRLSKEGAQLLVQEATMQKKEVQNLVPLTTEETKVYFAGHDLPRDLGEEAKAVILTYEDNVLGWAKYKEGKILNFLPKIHRGEVILSP